MSKTQQLSKTAQEGIRSTLSGEGLVHKYALNDKKAAKVLSNNAKLPLAEQISDSPQTTHVQLNTGAFSQVIFPLFNYWKMFPPNQVLTEGDVQVTLKELRIDEEVNGKKVDGLAKFIFEDKKVSLFAYHTNQTIMIQGVCHKEFFSSFLAPVLKKNFVQKSEEITKFNKMVLEALSPKSVDMNDSIMDSVTPERGLRSRTRRTSAPCEDCGKDFSSTSLLKFHAENSHSNRKKP